jgi:hypothetical protein
MQGMRAMRKTTQQNRVSIAFTVVLGVGVSVAGCSGSPNTETSSTDEAMTGQVLTDEQIAGLTMEGQAKRLDPLRAIAEAVGQAGREGDLADIYGSLIIDANHELVYVYVTDPGQASRVLASAEALDPSIDTAKIRIEKAAYAYKTLVTASEQLLDLGESNKLPYSVFMVGPKPDASGLEVDVDDPAAAQSKTTSALAESIGPEAGPLEIALTFRQGHALKAKSWAQDKWSDNTPFIGGDPLTTNGRGWGCTAGLPAVRSNGHPVMITAAHCFGVGAKLYTRGGSAGAYNNGRLGHYVGTVTERVTTPWDAEVIDGANNNADESDTTTFKPLTSTAYSYVGDYVCHDGQRSFFYYHHDTPCNIKVTNQDKYCGPTSGCPGLRYTARGVWGVAINHGWGAADGDSGATIFAIKRGDSWSGPNRQARGVLSDGDPGDGAPGVFWTEAVDIFRYFGLKLNPKT